MYLYSRPARSGGVIACLFSLEAGIYRALTPSPIALNRNCKSLNIHYYAACCHTQQCCCGLRGRLPKNGASRYARLASYNPYLIASQKSFAPRSGNAIAPSYIKSIKSTMSTSEQSSAPTASPGRFSILYIISFKKLTSHRANPNQIRTRNMVHPLQLVRPHRRNSKPMGRP